jgi:hypothetical protein
MILRRVFLIFTLTLTSCTTVAVSSFDGQRRPPTTGNVEVHTDRANIKRPYREIGLVVVDDGESGAWGLSSEATLIQKLIAKARSIGADGVILLPSEQQQRNIGWGGAYNSVNRRIVRGSAFAFTSR